MNYIYNNVYSILSLDTEYHSDLQFQGFFPWERGRLNPSCLGTHRTLTKILNVNFKNSLQVGDKERKKICTNYSKNKKQKKEKKKQSTLYECIYSASDFQQELCLGTIVGLRFQKNSYGKMKIAC